jgi:nitroimidazol reductase NimA-like FMN-containing flavoprotein (pyridoxamine 5'-phosphate oxidase superfamily)
VKQTPRTTVKRAPKRGHYDRATVNEILDSNFVCQIAFVHEDHPVIIPTIYGRHEDVLYLHGATVSRMLVALEKGIPLSVNVTRTDGIVLARSAFHHSLNYRSVTLFGKAIEVKDDEERMMALKVISDQIIPGRWEEVRAPSAKEMKATKILKIAIEEGSAKIRTGPPVDDKPDYELPVWAGVLPIETKFGDPVADPELNPGTPMANSVQNLLDGDPKST